VLLFERLADGEHITACSVTSWC